MTSLAMYPKQPFDFARRVGEVMFDVSDDSGGMHAAWPELWMSNLPVPDPFVHFSSWQALPRYGFGIRFGGVCVPYNPAVSGSGDSGCGPDCHNSRRTVVTVSSAITVDDYRENDSDGGDTGPQNPGTLDVVHYGCVTEPTRRGQLNHFEIDVSRDRIAVYGTDAGRSRPLVHLVTIANAALGFTRGYIWLEDVHYNANKDINGDTPLQAMNTFTWDNVGFNGPILPRDLGFDAPDSLTRLPSYPRLENLGWYSTASAPTPTNWFAYAKPAASERPDWPPRFPAMSASVAVAHRIVSRERPLRFSRALKLRCAGADARLKESPEERAQRSSVHKDFTITAPPRSYTRPASARNAG